MMLHTMMIARDGCPGGGSEVLNVVAAIAPRPLKR